MVKEIITHDNNKESFQTAGWFRCSKCNFQVCFKGKTYYLAETFSRHSQLIVCSVCDPQNGLEPEIRTNKPPRPLGFAADGLG